MNSSRPPSSDQTRLDLTFKRFDEENARDPNRESTPQGPCPRELLYAQRLSEWVMRLAPDAPEELRLAARSQHICRWSIPRDTYPMTRPGYLRWRSDLKEFHARKAGETMRETGWPDDLITRVEALILKKNFPNDPLSQVLEDALCLVFLQYQFSEFVTGKDETKVIGVLQKTWKKMTPDAQAHALALPLTVDEKLLIQKALAGKPDPR